MQSLNLENAKNTEVVKKAQLLQQRAIKSKIKGLREVKVVDYNADPLEFVFTFENSNDAELYNLELQTIDSKYQHSVVGNTIVQLRPVDDVLNTK